MSNTYTDPNWIKALPNTGAEFAVGDSDPQAKTDVLNRPSKGIAAIVKRLVNTVWDGVTLDLSDAATTTPIASSIRDVCYLTNRTGLQLSAGDVVALDSGADASVVLADVQGSLKSFVVAGATITAGVPGVFLKGRVCTVKVTGAVTRGHYLRKSATTRALEDTGTAQGDAQNPTAGSVGIALSAAAGPGLGSVTALLFVVPYSTVSVSGLQASTVRLTSDFTTTSASYVDVTSATITFTTGARRVLLAFAGVWDDTATPINTSFTFTVDGANIGAGTNNQIATEKMIVGGRVSVAGMAITNVLTAASHTFKVQMKEGGGGGTLTLRNSESNGIFSAIELP